jgi:nicotinamide mononucleotide adenylyltransferase/SAM-dependent methyltransferase
MAIGLLVGRFQVVTVAMAQWLAGLRGFERLVVVITSADHANTRRNPLSAQEREQLLRPALAAAGVPFEVVRVADVAQSEAWVAHVLRGVQEALGLTLTPEGARVLSQNRDVKGLFEAAGFTVEAREVKGLTPQELLERVASGRPWADGATEATRAFLSQPEVLERLRAIFSQRLLNDDGELGHHRDFQSYGAQMDASLRQKLDELVPFVVPGCIVDLGCGTGKLLVELSRLYPESAFVGVDLSREFLRLCDENTYASQDVTLHFGNIIEKHVPDGSASTLIFSSVTHEIYSYSGYSLEALDRALSNACAQLRPGGRVLIRDGVSPGPQPVLLQLLTPQVRATFERFAREFKHGQGAAHQRVSADTVRISAHLANEFICKKDYLKNWHLEVHEEFGAHTLEGYRAALVRAGLSPIHVKGTRNPWIVANRYAGQVALFDEGGVSLPFFDTNCVVVGERA